MDIKTVFLFFGISLTIYALVISFLGLRLKDFPSKNGLIGLIALALVLVAGTATYAVKLSVEEAHEREEGHDPTGEESHEAVGIRIIQPDNA